MATPTGKPAEMPPPSELSDEPRPEPRMVEPERIPSMREPAERWVPETADVNEAPPVSPEAQEPSDAPSLDEERSFAGQPFESMPLAEVEPPAPEPPAPEVQPQPEPEPEPEQALSKWPTTLKETFARMDAGWGAFRAAASAWPSERMDERIEEDGWSRKQMLAHVSAWHDATHDRLGKMILSGQPEDGVPDEDAFNARIARQAIGRTAGEILKEMEMTYNRLRRQVSRLNDQQIRADDGWAAQVIAGNTYEHYQEHAPDIYQPPIDPNAKRR